MPGVARALAEQHARCAELFAAAERAAGTADWKDFEARLIKLRDMLSAHFRFEEERLFPVFEEVSGLSAPTEDLRVQHDDMRAVLWALSSASAAHDPESCRSEFATLVAMFRQHTAHEEEVMYPAFERALGAKGTGVAALARKPAAEPELLDVRALEPPEPFMRITAALARAPAAGLRVLIHREPLPLYEVLTEQGYRYRARALDDGSFEILITRK